MLRKTIICLLPLLLLAGCKRSNDKETTIWMPQPNAAAPEMQAPPPPFVPPPDFVVGARSANVLFSVQHELMLRMPHASVAIRFEAARDACLKDKGLDCTLTSASLNANGTTVGAQLSVAMPHDKVAIFENRLLKPLPQDGDGKIEVASRSTTAENQTEAAADIERELAQAIAYRDQLEELAKRPNLTVEEIIKIHSELGEAQTAVENAIAAKRASNSSIRLERLNVSLEETIASPALTSAFDGFWRNALGVLSDSTANMLFSVVNALPWLPIVVLVVVLGARLTRRFRHRRTTSTS